MTEGAPRAPGGTEVAEEERMPLEELRNDLADVDRRLLALVARRQELVRRVGEAKNAENRPLRDFAQEKQVLGRARSAARELGVPPAVAQEVMTLLVRQALTVQEQQRVASRAGGDGRRALVIGGSGRMGSWFARFLASQDFVVEIADPAPTRDDYPRLEDWRDSPLDHDLVVVATDLRTTRGILGRLAERRPPGIVLDLGSLKTPLQEPLERLARAGVAVTSIHPMFGPGTEMLSGQHVILVDQGCEEANSVARELFAPTMAEVVSMSLEEHDRVVAFVLGLSHALNIAFFSALAASGNDLPDLARLSSTTFSQQLEVAARVAAENPHLYFEIQQLNEYGLEALSLLREAVETLHETVVSANEERFVELMERGNAYLGAAAAGDGGP